MLDKILDKINFGAFVDNLKYMGIGMLGVLMIVAIIMGATYLISYFTAKLEAMRASNEITKK